MWAEELVIEWNKGGNIHTKHFYCILELFQEISVKILFDFSDNSVQWIAISKSSHKQGNQSSESLANLFESYISSEM